VLKNFTSSIPVRVGGLAEALGLRVVLASLPLNISGLIQPEGADKFVIKVNRFESKERQRFTIAHEIAHYLLHRDKIQSGVIDSVLYRSKLSSRTEAEANKMAAEIVMPTKIFRALTADHIHPLSDSQIGSFASDFGVSKQALKIRAS
jgi:Zn-dependent peptidase ImmA (M78 family)